MTTNKSFKYWQWRTNLVSMFGYSLFYFVRKNFSFAIPGLSEEYGITKTSFGVILTIGTIVYGLSRFGNGILADRINGRNHMGIALLLCAAANYAFGFSDQLSTMITGDTSGTLFVSTMVFIFGIILLLNNLFQGAGYPPCSRLLAHWIPANELATKMSFWNTSHSIGASLAAVLCGYLAVYNWRYCFWAPATLALVGVVLIFLKMPDTPSSVGLPELHKVNKKGKEGDAEFKAFVKKMVYRNPIIWTLACANFMVYIVRFSVQDWGPTFLKEARGMDISSAGWTVAIFEIFGIVGTILFGWITDRFFKGRAHRACVVSMLGVAIFMTIFLVLPKETPMWIMVTMLAMAGFFIYGPQALIGIAASNQATNRAAATANGFVGLFGYASGLVSGIGVGAFVDLMNKVNPEKSWDYVFMGMIGVAIIGMLIFSLIWNAKADGYAESE